MNRLRSLLPLAAAVLLSSCSLFHREPPLPRRAQIESTGSEQEFVSLVQDADIIYFPSEAASLASRSDTAWKILTALQLSRSSFAIGYDWSSREGGRREYLDQAARLGAQTLALTDGISPGQGDANQSMAAKIAAYFLEHPRDKLLLFVGRERLALSQGIPYFVAQRTKARQLILNPRKAGNGPRLLARN